jgi:hypothetical protein
LLSDVNNLDAVSLREQLFISFERHLPSISIPPAIIATIDPATMLFFSMARPGVVVPRSGKPSLSNQKGGARSPSFCFA